MSGKFIPFSSFTKLVNLRCFICFPFFFIGENLIVLIIVHILIILVIRCISRILFPYGKLGDNHSSSYVSFCFYFSLGKCFNIVAILIFIIYECLFIELYFLHTSFCFLGESIAKWSFALDFFFFFF